MTTTEMIMRFSPRQDEMAKALIRLAKEVKVFEYDGVFFLGDKQQAACEFAYNNPTGGDFYVWLQDNYSILK